ncbi:MAG: hypothetical protein M0P73_16590 [Syntrophobacterales bacterium]|jgi:hypothetical protein|nr:hypothetical protein [Syntrophobacterales bacterium]
MHGRKAGPPLGLPDPESSPHPRINVGSEELDHIIQACKNLDDVTQLAQFASSYKNVGWSPVALDDTGARLQVDFDQPQATWSNLLIDLALKKARVSLAIRLEPDSRLFVLRVNPAFAQEFLDGLGDWRSPCTARAGNSWENHFLVLPQTWHLSPESLGGDQNTPLSVLGPGRMIPVPPSPDPASRETWRWLNPPWQQPPRHPSSGLLLLLEEVGAISRRNPTFDAGLPTWEHLYPNICRSQELLHAIMTPVATRELYYQTILYEALRAGFRDLGILLGLLWHAPHGATRPGLEGQQQLTQWAQEIQWLLSAESGSPPLAPVTGTASFPLWEKPAGAAPAANPENLWGELDFLAGLTEELEKRVEDLERQQLAADSEPQSGSAPPQPERASTSLTLRKSREELEELRRALEAFLSKDQESP